VGAAVGAGIGVGSGVGVAFGVGSGVGVAVGVGAGVVGETSNVAVTRIGSVGVTDELGACAAAETCSPLAAPAGTLNDARKLPRPFVDTLGMPAVASSHVNATASLARKPVPTAVTFVPGAPLVGVRVNVGPDASVPTRGTA
jgi:hypothetical protein